MSFDPNMTIPDYALKDFKAMAHNLETHYPVKTGLLTRIYLHWCVSGYNNEFPEYNLEVVKSDKGWKIDITGNPQDNAPGLNNNAEHSHTWHRNTGAIGISIAGMLNATINNFGEYPLTNDQLLYLCGAVAAAAKAYGIDTNGVVGHGTNHSDDNGNNVNTKGEKTILTHGECAIIDFYQNQRWDLGTLEPLPAGESLTSAKRIESGNKLRTVIHRIKAKL